MYIYIQRRDDKEQKSYLFIMTTFTSLNFHFSITGGLQTTTVVCVFMLCLYMCTSSCLSVSKDTFVSVPGNVRSCGYPCVSVRGNVYVWTSISVFVCLCVRTYELIFGRMDAHLCLSVLRGSRKLTVPTQGRTVKRGHLSRTPIPSLTHNQKCFRVQV